MDTKAGKTNAYNNNEQSYKEQINELKIKHPRCYLMILALEYSGEPIDVIKAQIKSRESEDNKTARPMFKAKIEMAQTEISKYNPQYESENKEIENDFLHSEDYRSINFKGERYTLTSFQAEIIQILHEAYQKNTPEIGQPFILEKINSKRSRLRDFFKSSPGIWGNVIIPGRKKGTYRLNL